MYFIIQCWLHFCIVQTLNMAVFYVIENPCHMGLLSRQYNNRISIYYVITIRTRYTHTHNVKDLTKATPPPPPLHSNSSNTQHKHNIKTKSNTVATLLTVGGQHSAHLISIICFLFKSLSRPRTALSSLHVAC